MKPYIWIAAGCLLLLVDLVVETPVAYPAYEMLARYGTKTQELVMLEVVGTHVKIDALSDVLGYLCLLIGGAAALRGSVLSAKKLVLVNAAGAIVQLLCLLLPFFAGGVTVYGGEYALHWASALLEAAAVIVTIHACLKRLEIPGNRWSQVWVSVFVMFGAAAGVMSRLHDFYGLHKSGMAYWAAQVLFTILYWYYLRDILRLSQDRRSGDVCH